MEENIIKMNEKELIRFYKKYIDRNLYRVVSSEYINKILKKGINPKIDPYEQLKPDIKKLFNQIGWYENESCECSGVDRF